MHKYPSFFKGNTLTLWEGVLGCFADVFLHFLLSLHAYTHTSWISTIGELSTSSWSIKKMGRRL